MPLSEPARFLLKYAPSLRFLENGLFRFTQPSALNDPEEAKPEILFGKYSTEDREVARRKIQRYSMGQISEDNLESMLQPAPADRMDEKNFPGLWPATEKRLREQHFETSAEMDDCIVERAIVLCRELADRSLGIFSLTQSTEEPMWASYGGHDRAGVVVRFHSRHPFFKRNAMPVEYYDTPKYASMNQGLLRIAGVHLKRRDILDATINEVPAQLLLRKRLPWAPEREWRLIAHLDNAEAQAGQDSAGFPICLFRIPAEAIHSVMFDYRATDSVTEGAIRKIDFDSRWDHLEVWRRRTASRGGATYHKLR